MAYAQYSMSSLVAQIAGLLDDPQFIQWKYEEIKYGVIEALRYWGALTSYWRIRGQFSSVRDQPWYDLSNELPTLRSRTTTFNDIVTEIDFHCFELPGGVAGTGLTSQFNVTSIVNAVVRARNRLVMDAGLPLSTTTTAFTGAPDGRIEIDENIVYLRHGYWNAPSGAWSPLRPTDAWAQDAYSPLWTLEPGLPFAFSQSVTPPLDVQLFPLPNTTGTIEWLVARTLNFDDPITVETLLNIPDEFAHAVKYSALADLFTMDGEANDPQRADYAERRYLQTVEIAKNHKSVARVQIDGVPVGLSTLTMLDNAYPRWRMSSGKPTAAGCDMDMIALASVPNGSFGVQCDVLQSAPIPANDDDFLQIGRELIPNIIDYAQHYLSFKLAGQEFAMSIPQYDNFMSSAKSKNAVQSKQIKFMGPLYGMPGRENVMQMGATDEKAGTGMRQPADA